MRVCKWYLTYTYAHRAEVNRRRIRISLIQCIVLYILMSRCRQADSTDYFLQHPVSQSVTLNSTFILACRLRVSLLQETAPDLRKYTIQWVRNKFGLGTTREDIQAAGMEANSNFFRYDLPYNLNEGQYDLQIRYAKSMDEGQYVCQLRYDGNAYFSQTADVRVLVASETPTLMQSDLYNAENRRHVGLQVSALVTEGDYLRLHCIAKNGKPGAKLFWMLNGSPFGITYTKDGTKGNITSPVEGNVSVRSITTSEPPFLVTTVSEVIVFVTEQHHGSKIKCFAQNEGYENYHPQPASTKINIQYAPVVKMRIAPVTGRRDLLENDVVTIRCSAKGRPDNFTWSWMINGSLIDGETSEHYRLRLSRRLINVTVACVATTFAEGRDQTTLTFYYAPQFSNPNPIIYAGTLAEPLRLHCAVEGHPPPKVEWRLISTSPTVSIATSPTVTPTTGSGTLVGRGEVFERESIHESDFGTYICIAESKGFSPVSKKIILAKKTPPQIKPAEPVYAGLGASARLTCTVIAVPLPPPEGLLWFRRDLALKTTSNRKFSTQEFLGGVIFVLSITHVMSTDFGFYNCSAENAYGSDSQTMELRRDDELAISSLGGVLASLIATVVLGFLILFFYRRRQYRKESVQTKLPDEKKWNAITNARGKLHHNNMPQIMDMGFKNDVIRCHSSLDSTEAEVFGRYQKSSIRSPSALSNHHMQSPSSNSSTVVTNHCISMRPFHPISKYDLGSGNDRRISVCTNGVTFASHSREYQLADGISKAIRIAPEYHSTPISYANVLISPETSYLTTLDSGIIVNPQVTNV